MTASQPHNSDYDVIVLGGGAAGLMCAMTAASRGRQVIVLEASNRIGKKILMSGGGRCNFTNLHCGPDRFLSANPHFCVSALSRYTQHDFIALVEKHGIAYHEKADGQLFCDISSKEIVAMLRLECSEASVRILENCQIASVSHGERFCVASSSGAFRASSLVVATGGLSIPRMGASDFGYRLARQFGLNVLPTSAGLVPFTFSGENHELCSRLSGVSIPATATACGASFTGNILFTHRGISGPAALQLSNFWSVGNDITLELMPATKTNKMLHDAKAHQPKTLLRTILSEHMPKALVLELQGLLWDEIAERPLAEMSDAALVKVAAQLGSWALRPSGTEGYRTAEVTRGGIDTDELSSKTMQSKRVPGLFCIGEVVDVTGQLGGFNFQWAWASGHAAGLVA